MQGWPASSGVRALRPQPPKLEHVEDLSAMSHAEQQENLIITPRGVGLDSRDRPGILTSHPIEVPAARAVAVTWVASLPEETQLVLAIRSSSDGHLWPTWQDLGEDPHPGEDRPPQSRSRPLPLEESDRFLQYRATLVPSGYRATPILETIGFHFFPPVSTPPESRNDIFNARAARLAASVERPARARARACAPVHVGAVCG